jgi:hypothetical protein
MTRIFPPAGCRWIIAEVANRAHGGPSHEGSPLDEFKQAIADASWAVYNTGRLLPFSLLLPFMNETAKGIVVETNGPATR